MNPYVLAFDGEEMNRQLNERMREAAHEHLIRQLQAQQPSLWARSREALAQILISLGQKLKGQHQPDIIVPA